ncbi:anthranilate synthase component I [Alkalinema sp. FACHB-956]|uniref:anthranilate synthase component I n=1 Tax=Alkalinema sp. FACHB-956 TaxID=2692768 RepID=UPI0016868F63|nr:anthranilate synthase component I [Alkalinema sp. FACHB-956]MBD2327408.1 anthranilate synthase component I [Alkalinema sp. FACHB-956]
MVTSWQWRSYPLADRTGSDIFAALFVTEPVATLLESPYPASPDYPQLGRYSICAGNPRQVADRAQLWTPPVGTILPFLRQQLAGESGATSEPKVTLQDASQPLPASQPPTHLPFIGGWLGWLGYDLAWEIEKLPYTNPDPLPFPVAYWYEPDCFAVLDHQAQVLWLAVTDAQDFSRLEVALSESMAIATQANDRKQLQKASSPVAPLKLQTDRAAYEAAILKAKAYIQAGDIFQANLSLRFETETQASSWAIYQALQTINPSPFASYWRTPYGDVISCSPERLVKQVDRQVETRPIAGTRPRGMTLEIDQELASELRSNAKEQAEHIMLVDLERNDLGRVCEWGTVQVDELLVIERYSHVMHLVSNVIGTLRSNVDSIDVIQALFPGGTITGCPKVRCMEIIEELEPVRRSLFYGSCGYLDLRGNLDLNILIRTLLYAPQDTSKQDTSKQDTSKPLPDNAPQTVASQTVAVASQTVAPQVATVWGQVGAGIVADSDPEREWFESLQKAKAQLAALDLH